MHLPYRPNEISRVDRQRVCSPGKRENSPHSSLHGWRERRTAVSHAQLGRWPQVREAYCCRYATMEPCGSSRAAKVMIKGPTTDAGEEVPDSPEGWSNGPS